MWELLCHKYGVKETSSSAPEVPREKAPEPFVVEVATRPTDAAISPTKVTPPLALMKKNSSPQSVPIVSRDTRELWLLRANLLRLAAGIGLPWHFFERRVKEPFRSSFESLQTEFQSWEHPPKIDDEFWRWRAQRLAKTIRSEFPLVSVPELTGLELYTALRSRFHGDGLPVSEAFELFYREKESAHEARFGWMKTPSDDGENVVGSRRFWEKKFFDFRNANCPRMSDATVMNALDLGEVRGLPWEHVFEGFIRQSQRYSFAVGPTVE